MSEELYLIAHKVRGQPAFDIAIILDQLDEDGDIIWIIPTSGHRAYPYWHTEIDGLMYAAGYIVDVPMPPDLPDHYHLEAPKPQASLLDRLNLRPTQPPIVRRI